MADHSAGPATADGRYPPVGAPVIEVPPEVAVHDRIMDAYYGKMGEEFMRKTQQRVHWVCAQTRGRRVLDVGCSQGIVPILLGREGRDVLGLDPDEQAIEVAKAYLASGPAHASANVDFVVGDFIRHDFGDRKFDAVVMSEVLEHLVDPVPFIERAAALLEPSGRLVVTVPFGINDFIDHKRTYYLTEPYQLLSRWFHIETVQLFGRWIGFAGVLRKEPLAAGASAEIACAQFSAAEEAFNAIERSITAELRGTREKLAAANQKYRDLSQVKGELHAQLAGANSRLTDVNSQLADASSQLADATSRLADMAAAEVQYQQDERDTQERVRRLESARAKAVEASGQYRHWMGEARAGLSFLQHSLAFQLGSILTFAFRSPSNFVKTPLRLLRLARAAFWRGPDGRPPRVFIPDLPGNLMSASGAARPKSSASAAQVRASGSGAARRSASALLPDGAELSILGWPAPKANGKPVVMAVMDEFTTGCFDNDLSLILPRPDNWFALAEKYKPEMFFIESAWKGNGGSWQYRVGEYANRPGEEITDMALYASERGIPLVFWNKEDPVHHQKFMVTAKLADHIFTTDANMCASYREKTGNRSAHALAFAAQPALHFPAVLQGRQSQSCFAGSWYGDRHEARGHAMRWLLQAANRQGLVIFDRNHGNAEFTFPEEYHAAIRGGLPYKELCAEYRNYRVFLNVNSVTESPTMFSRRVFELMACGTPVVSTYARGIEEMFERKAVWLVNNEAEAEEAIRTLLTDDVEWRRRSLLGIRDVFAHHTYAHRLNQLFEQTGMATRLPLDPKVLLLATAAGDGEVERVVEIARAQRYPALSVRIGAPVTERRRLQLGSTEVLVVPAAELLRGDYVAAAADAGALGWISAAASYGSGYVRDLTNAMAYSPDAQGWGKALEEDAFAFDRPGQWQSSLWRPEQFRTDLQAGALAERVAAPKLFIADRADYAPADGYFEVLEV